MTQAEFDKFMCDRECLSIENVLTEMETCVSGYPLDDTGGAPMTANDVCLFTALIRKKMNDYEKKMNELDRIKSRIRLAYLSEYKPSDPFDAKEIRNLVLDDIASVYDKIEL